MLAQLVDAGPLGGRYVKSPNTVLLPVVGP